jgi:hypothetical protein
MNERIQELAEQATTIDYGVDNGFDRVNFDKEKFAELILLECTQVLFNESERLYDLSIEETGWQNSRDYEMCSENCMDNIAAIERHFGIE